MTCETCGQTPCVCIASSNPTKTPRTWLLQTCTAPGCTVLIRSLPGEQEAVPICKWHKTGMAYNSAQIVPRPPAPGPLLSLEEFGTDLFDAIKEQAAMREAFRLADRYRSHGDTQAAEQVERQVVVHQKALEAILKKNTIAPADLQRLLAIA